METRYYDGSKLLSLKDLNGKKPGIYICDGTRTGGKTVYFNRLLTQHHLKKNYKFMLMFRFQVELDNVAPNFFKDIGELFFHGMEMTEEKKSKGKYLELSLDGKPCGYAVAINAADFIKKYSHLFTDVNEILFDEFQSETNHYVPDEINKLRSIMTSVSRGHGEQVRYVPLYMLSNSVTMLNPYYTALGISSRLKTDTKFLRGDGFVLEHMYNPSAAQAQRDNPFNRAFADQSYLDYSTENVYLHDSSAFIDRIDGRPQYLCTIKYKGSHYSIKEYLDQGLVYCDTKADMTYPVKFSLTTDDHNINYVMLQNNKEFIWTLRWYFQRGCFRFKDLNCKEVILSLLTY